MKARQNGNYPMLDLHGKRRVCELRDLKFIRKNGDVTAELTLGFYLDDAELYDLGLSRAAEAIEKGALRRGLGRYDLVIETNACEVRAEGAYLDKPRVEAEEVKRQQGLGQLALPGFEYPVLLLFVVAIPLIGDCRNQVWGLLTDSVPHVAFTDPSRTDHGQADIEDGEAPQGEAARLPSEAYQRRAAENFRQTMADIAGPGGSVSISGPDGKVVRIKGRGRSRGAERVSASLTPSGPSVQPDAAPGPSEGQGGAA